MTMKTSNTDMRECKTTIRLVCSTQCEQSTLRLDISPHWLTLSLQASLKESELRLAEIRRAKKEFESRVVKPVKENRLEVKEPEKVLQFIADKLKVK